MPWFKVDDGFHGHPKVMGLTPAAVGVWLLTGTWSAQYLTDGAVPRGVMTRLGGTDSEAHELMSAGLWDATDQGFQFHEWAEYQPSKEEVEAERAAARDRMRQVRAKRKGVAKDETSSDDVPANTSGTSGEVRSTPTQPDPAQPGPAPSTSNEVEGTPAALSPFCSEHPGGTKSKCRACGSARMAFTAAQAAEKAKPTPMPRRADECPEHPNWPLPCDKCAQIAAEAVAS